MKRNKQKSSNKKNSPTYHVYWHQFLRLSPSYFLAYQVRNGELPYDPASPKGFPKDFDRVLKVYDVFGDVYNLTQEQWFEKIRSELTASRRPQPMLRLIARYDRREERPKKKLADDINQYLKVDWLGDGSPNFVLMAVPLALPINGAIEQLRGEMKRVRESWKLPKKLSHTFPLASPRLQERTLMLYLKMIYFHAAVPRARLWQVGAKAGQLPSAGTRIGLRAKASPNNLVDRNRLNAIAFRAHKRSHLVAENAARGLFPSIKPCPDALPQDWKVLQKRIVWYIALDRTNREKRLYH